MESLRKRKQQNFLWNLSGKKISPIQFLFQNNKNIKETYNVVKASNYDISYLDLHLIEWVKDLVPPRFHHDSLVVLGRTTLILSRDGQIVY